MGKEELIPLGVRSTSRRGGSIGVNIPAVIAEKMGLKPGDPVVFFFDPKTKRLILEKVSAYTTPSGLTFSVSKDLARKLLKEEKESEK